MSNLSQYFDLSNDLCCILNGDAVYQRVNTTFLNVLGYKNDEVIGSKFYDLVHPDDVSSTEKEYEAVKAGKRNEIIHNRLRAKTGDYKWFSWSSIAYDSHGLFYTTCHDITELQQLRGDLSKEKADRQGSITRAILKTQESEREKLSRELHDNVNQIITSVKLQVEYLQTMHKEDSPLLKRSSHLLQLAIDEIRTICNQLSTKSLEIENICDSIRHLIDNISASKKYEVKFTVKGIADIPIDKEVKIAVYRIVQEQLTNIAKHAETDQVDISLQYANGLLTLKIQDYGKGFDPNSRKKGNGLLNMRARAESLGGWLTIESIPGTGCLLSAYFPIEIK
jgi:PAS domain S-box-containing protein